jgi:ubiquinone/menaquinone biosynthesis C-methylase UbiE
MLMDPSAAPASSAPSGPLAASSGGATVPGVTDPMFVETQRAFDSVAETYDGPRGNNMLIQRMRELSWRSILQHVSPGARLLDIGCGTGIDARYFATRGYRVCAIDPSGGMIARTIAQAVAGGLSDHLEARRVGAHELACLDSPFDAAYSNFGPLNCVPDLGRVAWECARLLVPQGCLILTVIGRVCPWELAYYLLQGRPRRAWVRFAPAMTAVGLNRHTAWVHYYTPREFYRCFAQQFELVRYQALGLFVPPPYLLNWHARHPALGRTLEWLDDRVGGWPLLRAAGDHFLMVLRRRC